MKVKAIKLFEDIQAKVDRKPGDVWEVDEARFEALNSTEFGKLVEAVEEPKPAPKRTRAKKAE